MAVSFEGYERRIDKINKVLAENGISSLEEALQICRIRALILVRSLPTLSPSHLKMLSGLIRSAAHLPSRRVPRTLLRPLLLLVRASRLSAFPAL